MSLYFSAAVWTWRASASWSTPCCATAACARLRGEMRRWCRSASGLCIWFLEEVAVGSALRAALSFPTATLLVVIVAGDGIAQNALSYLDRACSDVEIVAISGFAWTLLQS